MVEQAYSDLKEEDKQKRGASKVDIVNSTRHKKYGIFASHCA